MCLTVSRTRISCALLVIVLDKHIEALMSITPTKMEPRLLDMQLQHIFSIAKNYTAKDRVKRSLILL